MTALDQAFIRAYSQQKPAAAAAEPSADKESPVAPQGRPAQEPPATVPLSEVLAAMAEPAARKDPDAPAPPSADVGALDAVYRLDVGAGPRETSSAPGPQPVPAPHGSLLAPAFRPVLQVECFTWPTVCRRLTAAAGEQFDRLAVTLAAAKNQGRKVLAFTGCRRGEGTTTLLLCTARCLVERGLKIALVDADLADPQLARRLGLQPQLGWEAVLAGHALLVDVVIESAENRMALLPWRDPLVGAGEAPVDPAGVAECLDALASSYDLVLVDFGPVEDPPAVSKGTVPFSSDENRDGPPPIPSPVLSAAGGVVSRIGQAKSGSLRSRRGEPLVREIINRLDAAVLVHNIRLTSRQRLADAEQRLAGAGIVQAGIIQNLVRS